MEPENHTEATPEYEPLLTVLREMQQSPYHAVRKKVLHDAEVAIERLERERDAYKRQVEEDSEDVKNLVKLKDYWKKRAESAERRVQELEEVAREFMESAVWLSAEYLSAFDRWPDDATIQGWDKARWVRALAAGNRLRALLSRKEQG